MLLIKEIVMMKKYIPGKIRIDTFPGRNMRVSPMAIIINEALNTYHVLDTYHLYVSQYLV